MENNHHACKSQCPRLHFDEAENVARFSGRRTLGGSTLGSLNLKSWNATFSNLRPFAFCCLCHNVLKLTNCFSITQIQTVLLALGATIAAAVKPLKIDGNSFVDDDGNKFQIVGMAYQPGGQDGYMPEKGEDPLSDPEICMRDAALMQILGINAIRVYNLSPEINHDECATIFNAVSSPVRAGFSSRDC